MSSAYYNPAAEDDPYCLHVGPFGPNPSVTAHRDRFYMVCTKYDHIDIVSAPSLDAFTDTTTRSVTTIWTRSQNDKPLSYDIWNPKMFLVNNRWYIYASGVQDRRDGEPDSNYSRRLVYWVGPPGDHSPDQFGPQGWAFKYRLEGMPPYQWANDPAVFAIDEELYLAYSGWELLPQRHDPAFSADALVALSHAQRPAFQHLYIVHMAAPDRVDTRDPVKIATPTEPWEFTDNVGVVAAPVHYRSPDGSWEGLLISSAGSWSFQDSKIATLEFTGHRSSEKHKYGNTSPLDPQNWVKSRWPLLQSWNNRFVGEQPHVPPSSRRFSPDRAGAWGNSRHPVGYPYGPCSPTIVLTNSFNLRPARVRQPSHIQTIVTPSFEDDTKTLSTMSVSSAAESADTYSEKAFVFLDQNQRPIAGEDSATVPWVIFHARDPKWTFHAFAQRLFLDKVQVEGPHMRAWVGTPVDRAEAVMHQTDLRYAP